MKFEWVDPPWSMFKKKSFDGRSCQLIVFNSGQTMALRGLYVRAVVKVI